MTDEQLKEFEAQFDMNTELEVMKALVEALWKDGLTVNDPNHRRTASLKFREWVRINIERGKLSKGLSQLGRNWQTGKRERKVYK